MTNDKPTTSNVISAVVLSAVLLTGTLTIALPFQQSFAFTSGDSIFGHSVGGGHGYIQEYNATGSLVNEFQPDCIIVNDNCNGRGLAFDGVDLWYTVVNGTQFTGDGLIHKVARNGGADITTIPDPYGIDGRGIGALDYDFSTHTLWAISYIADNGINVAGNQTVFQIDPSDGTILANCDVKKTTGGAGTETLALDPNGTTFWTNAGEPEDFVDEYELPNAVDQGQCVATGNSFNPTSQRIGGLDFNSSGNFINSDTFGSMIYDMGTNPSDPEIDSFATTRQIEDIAIIPPTGCSPGFWKTHTDETKYPNAWSSTSYAPDDDFETVFSTDLPAQYGTPTLEDALNAKGGNQVNQLLRFATATLLNAEQPNIIPEEDYDEAAEIIAIVSAVDWEDRDSVRSAIQQLAPQTDFLCPISGQ
jgi:hypothetical protein